jgi:hypothetical protein
MRLNGNVELTLILTPVKLRYTCLQHPSAILVFVKRADRLLQEYKGGNYNEH